MDLGLKNKKVLITAASGGLGPALAKSFWKEGASLFLVSRSLPKLKLLEKTLNSKKSFPNQSCQIYPIDLSTTESPEHLEKTLKSMQFSPDILIHHMGGTLGIKSTLCSHNDWTKVLWLNALFAIEFNRLMIESLKKKPWARIVHISSISSKSLRGSGPYASAKSLLDSYSTCLSRELGQTNVVSSVIQPGALLIKKGPWDDHMKNNPNLVVDFLRHHHASNRLGKANEIAPFVLMLASKHMTFGQGTQINIDGGTM